MTLKLFASTLAFLCCVACGSNDPEPNRNGESGKGGSGGAGAGAGAGTSGGSGTGAGSGAGSGDVDASVGMLPEFDAGTAPDRNMVEAGELCDRLSTIQCAGEAHCCEAPGRTYEQCKATMLDGCANQLHFDQIAMQPNANFDATIAASGFAGFEALAAKCDPSIALWGISLEGLRGMLQGTLAPGASCRPSLAQLNDPVVAGAAAASCTMLATHACLPAALSWTCTEKHGEGGDCFSDLNCLDGLFCNNPNATFGAKCAVRKATGAQCVNPNECATLACKKGVCAAGAQAAYCLQ